MEEQTPAGPTTPVEKKRGRPKTNQPGDEDPSSDKPRSAKKAKVDGEEGAEQEGEKPVVVKKKLKKSAYPQPLSAPGLVPGGIKRKRGRPAKNDQRMRALFMHHTVSHPNQVRREGYPFQSQQMVGEKRLNDDRNPGGDTNGLDPRKRRKGDNDSSIDDISDQEGVAMDDEDSYGTLNEFDISAPPDQDQVASNSQSEDGSIMQDSRGHKPTTNAAGGAQQNVKGFQKFNDNQRITQIFQAMNEAEKERFELFRQANLSEKQMKKILSMIPGTGKINKVIITLIKTVTKIYVGQLVEEAKLVQQQEAKDKADFEYYQQVEAYNQAYQELNQEEVKEEGAAGAEPKSEDIDMKDINFEEEPEQQTETIEEKAEQPEIAAEEPIKELPELPVYRVQQIGALHPPHLKEARRRLLERGELVAEKPKPMFLRKPRF